MLFKEDVHWHCRCLLAQCQQWVQEHSLLPHMHEWHYCRELGNSQNAGIGVENVDRWCCFGNSFLLSLHGGISSGCQTVGWALFLYLPKHLCTSSAARISHAPPRFPTSLYIHILQALHKQEPELTQLGLSPPAVVFFPFPLSSLSDFSHSLVLAAFLQHGYPEVRSESCTWTHTHWVLSKQCF